MQFYGRIVPFTASHANMPYPMYGYHNPGYGVGHHYSMSHPHSYYNGMILTNPPPGTYHTGDEQHKLFHNPLQPKNPHPTHYHPYNGFQPYPKPNNNVKPPGGNLGSILNSFKLENGSLDINKMANTAGQMMNALTQASQMAKGISAVFKA